MTPRPPPRAPGTLPSLVLGGFLVDFGRNLRDCSINLLIDFFIFSSASAVCRGTNRKNKQRTTNWVMAVMMKSRVLVCSLLMPVWGTVAGMPEASGYAAPGYACALACETIFLTCPKNMSERDITGPALPATVRWKILLFLASSPDPYFCWKSEEMGVQWGAQRYQSLRRIRPRPPQGASPWRPGGDFLRKEVTFTKHHYLLCLRHILPAQGAPLVTPLGPQAVQRASQCRFWAVWGGA